MKDMLLLNRYGPNSLHRVRAAQPSDFIKGHFISGIYSDRFNLSKPVPHGFETI